MKTLTTLILCILLTACGETMAMARHHHPTPSPTIKPTPTPTPTPAPTPSPTSTPIAKWLIHGCAALKSGDEHLVATDPNFKNPQIKYHRLRLSVAKYWPSETSKLDFSNVLADAKLAAANGQAISVSFGFGPQTPDWMKAKCQLLTNDDGQTFPKPWDSAFKGYVSTFVKEAGKQLNATPNIWQIFITGLQGKNAELRLNLTSPLSASDAAAYMDAGKYMIDLFASSFPDTAVMLTEAASAYDGDKGGAFSIALGNYGSLKYPHRFGNSYSAWKATSQSEGVLKLISTYAGKNPASVQQVMPSSDPRYEGTFEQSVEKFKDVPANGFEIYAGDLSKITQATNDALANSY